MSNEIKLTIIFIIVLIVFNYRFILDSINFVLNKKKTSIKEEYTNFLKKVKEHESTFKKDLIAPFHIDGIEENKTKTYEIIKTIIDFDGYQGLDSAHSILNKYEYLKNINNNGKIFDIRIIPLNSLNANMHFVFLYENIKNKDIDDIIVNIKTKLKNTELIYDSYIYDEKENELYIKYYMFI